MKLRYDIMWEPLLVGIGIAIVNLVLYVVFITPAQQFGIFFAFGLLVIVIGQMFLLAEIRIYYVRKFREKEKEKPKMTEEEQIQKYGGRVIFSMQELPGYGKAMGIYFLITFILVICYLVIPSNLISSGVRFESIPIYQIIDYAEFIFQLMHIIIIPGVHIVAILFGSFGLSWE
ncbi:MAG: hypothetical protein EAX96_19720 [Candidatus Lokiarchaeota archaeon]|nr:hypothetical protein [Candidatus Lokiarchaeota archaeon]